MLRPAANLSKTYEIWLITSVPRSPSVDADGRSANQSQVAPRFEQPECSSPCSRQSTTVLRSTNSVHPASKNLMPLMSTNLHECLQVASSVRVFSPKSCAFLSHSPMYTTFPRTRHGCSNVLQFVAEFLP